MAEVAEKPVEEEVKNGAKEGAEDEVVAVAKEGKAAAEKSKAPTEKSKDSAEKSKDAAEKSRDASDKSKDAAEKSKDAAEQVAADDEVADANGDGDGDADADGDSDLTKLERAIIRQVEYYFGDANLRRDKFLLEQISKDEEGWVPLTVLLTFKRLAAISSDAAAIVDALMKSDEGLLEISEDRQKLRRHPERPIPEHNEEVRKEIMSRTVYAKGFPLDTEMAELIEFFAPHEKVLHINMRKYLDKPTKTYKFKGSVFATFAKKEQAQEFVEKEKAVFKERELVRKWQEKYLEDKKEELKAKASKKKGKAAAAAEEERIKLPKGTVVFFEKCTEIVTREMLREAIEKIEGDWEIAYIDYSKGEKDGHIRFQEENTAAPFLEKVADKKIKLNDDIELTLRILEEEEEKAYLANAVEQMKNRRNHPHKHKGHHGHGNRKRRGGNDNRSEDKKKKVDDE